MAHRNTIKNLAYTMLFDASAVPEWVLHYRNIQNKVEVQLRGNM